MRILIAFAGAALISTAAFAHDVIHNDHSHAHGIDCGHPAIAHEGHVDFVHSGHLHAAHGGHTDEHLFAVSAEHPASLELVGHTDEEASNHGGNGDKHPMVQHGDHFDHIHDGRLHAIHQGHVDDHGPVTFIKS